MKTKIMFQIFDPSKLTKTLVWSPDILDSKMNEQML